MRKEKHKTKQNTTNNTHTQRFLFYDSNPDYTFNHKFVIENKDFYDYFDIDMHQTFKKECKKAKDNRIKIKENNEKTNDKNYQKCGMIDKGGFERTCIFTIQSLQSFQWNDTCLSGDIHSQHIQNPGDSLFFFFFFIYFYFFFFIFPKFHFFLQFFF